MLPTDHRKDLVYIKGIESDAPIPRDLQNVMTEIDGGVLNYVRRQMHCEKVTPEVRREALAFEKEMSRMSGW